MSEDFVFADQRSGGDLRHHESGVEAGAIGEERRQAFIERWIDQSFNAALRDAGERAEHDGEVVEGESERLTVEVAPGEDVAVRLLAHDLARRADFLWLREDQRIVDGGVHLNLKGVAAEGKGVAHGAMD